MKTLLWIVLLGLAVAFIVLIQQSSEANHGPMVRGADGTVHRLTPK